MHNKELKVKLVAKTHAAPELIKEAILDMGFEEKDIYIPEIGKDGCTPGNLLIWYAAKRCYMAFGDKVNKNITQVRDDMQDYFENILKSGHGSVCEHSSMSFSIEGVSRVFTGEMNRHRAGVAISEGSMRYIRLSDLGFWMPNSIREGVHTQLDDKLGNIFTPDEIAKKKHLTRELFMAAFEHMEVWMAELERIWELDESGRLTHSRAGFAAKKLLTSMFRRLIGMGVATGGTWTLNYRALRHVCELRGTPHAEEEIFDVANQITEIAKAEEPFIFGDFDFDSFGWKPKFHKV